MTEQEMKRLQSAYESGIDIEIWFDGNWYKFDAKNYGGFSPVRQYRIVGQKYVDEAEKQIKDLEWQLKQVIEDNDYYQKENEQLKAQIQKMQEKE